MYYLEIQGLFKALNKFKGFSMLYKPCFPSPSLSSQASPFFTHLHFSLHSLLVPLPCPFLFPVLIYLPSPLPLLPFSCVSSCICLSFPFNISPWFFHLSLFYPLHSLCSFFLLLHWILFPSLNPFFITSSSSLQLSSLLSSSPSSSLSLSLHFLFLISPFSIFFFISSIFLFTLLSLFSSFLLLQYILFSSSLPLPPPVFILPSYFHPYYPPVISPHLPQGPKLTFLLMRQFRN